MAPSGQIFQTASAFGGRNITYTNLVAWASTKVGKKACRVGRVQLGSTHCGTIGDDIA
jgi:hypothetical protein